MTISYIDKGPGLTSTIANAGYLITQLNGVMVSSDDVAVQAIIDGYSLVDAKQSVADQIDDEAKRLRDRFFKAVSPTEIASWQTKYAEAKKFKASGLSSDAPNLDAEATLRGVTLIALATRVVINFATTAVKEGRIAGIAGKHKDAVKALGSFALVLAYDWKTPMATV